MLSKKKSLKGFTLIEVLVAMAILAIASLVLVTMYASVAMGARENNSFNDRMSEQQKIIEKAYRQSGESDGLVDVYVNDNLEDKYITSDNTDTFSAASDLQFNMVCTYNAANTSWENNKNFVANCVVYNFRKIEDGQAVPDSKDNDGMTNDFKYFVADNSLVD